MYPRRPIMSSKRLNDNFLFEHNKYTVHWKRFSVDVKTSCMLDTSLNILEFDLWDSFAVHLWWLNPQNTTTYVIDKLHLNLSQTHLPSENVWYSVLRGTSLPPAVRVESARAQFIPTYIYINRRLSLVLVLYGPRLVSLFSGREPRPGRRLGGEKKEQRSPRGFIEGFLRPISHEHGSAWRPLPDVVVHVCIRLQCTTPCRHRLAGATNATYYDDYRLARRSPRLTCPWRHSTIRHRRGGWMLHSFLARHALG